MFGIEVDPLAEVAGARNLMPDVDWAVQNYGDIDIGIRSCAPTGLRTAQDELFQARAVDVFETLFECGERGFDRGG